MEPIFFEPVYKTVIWGGDKIAKILGKNVTGERIGESWEISAHKNGLSVIQNGELKGRTLEEVFHDASQKVKIFGTHCEKLEKFPILAKFLDANDNLSIQVHPDNEYALKNEQDSGKSEVWYIMECQEGARIVYGFQDHVNQDNLKDAIEKIEENVAYIEVHKGDFISIPAGTIHALMGGAMVCEVQQSSDVTYRVYDWNRLDKNGKPRELHKQRALDVINLQNQEEVHNYAKIHESKTIYESNVFDLDIIKIEEEQEDTSNEKTFFGYIVIEGKGKLEAGDFTRNIKRGDSFLIPANLGKYQILGNLKLLKIRV